MNSLELNEICKYIEQFPKCIIEYCDNKNFVIFKSATHYRSARKGMDSKTCWFDYDIDDETDGYIPFMVIILKECAKKGIDISQIKIKSC